mmetsp:Transcript_619/g.973  ORF Transcript_619/g.973 Transcript_619/m.973 type:complete len:361 (+) Transcript_619:92-1174(+)
MGRKKKRINSKSQNNKTKENEATVVPALQQQPIRYLRGEKAKCVLEKAGENPTASDLLASAIIYANGEGNKNAKVDHQFAKSEYCEKGEQSLQLLHQLENINTEEKQECLGIALNWFTSGCHEGCVQSMYHYSRFLIQTELVQYAQPWALEGAIRGFTNSIMQLFELLRTYLNHTVTIPGEDLLAAARRLQLKHLRVPSLLMNYWFSINNKYMTSFKVDRKMFKGLMDRMCIVCEKTDSEDTALTKCGKCKYYFYCSKECQKLHWKNGHMAECNHFCILKEYHEPFALKIRDEVIRISHQADTAATDAGIPELELLRDKLGLSRPKEYYEQNKSYNNDPIELLIARKDGTVHMRPSYLRP